MSLQHAVSVFSFILVLGGVCSSAWAESQSCAGACWEWLEMPHDGHTEEVCYCAFGEPPVCVGEGTVVARCLSGKEDGDAGGDTPSEEGEDASEAPPGDASWSFESCDEGFTCSPSGGADGAACVPSDESGSAEACEPYDEGGYCQGGALYTCVASSADEESGEWTATKCADVGPGFECWVSEGGADCVPPSECDPEDFAPYCEGNALVRCVDTDFSDGSGTKRHVLEAKDCNDFEGGYVCLSSDFADWYSHEGPDECGPFPEQEDEDEAEGHDEETREAPPMASGDQERSSSSATTGSGGLSTAPPGDCSEPPSVAGVVTNDVANLDFTNAELAVAMAHTLDVDPIEDGCIASIDMTLKVNGQGCALNLVFGVDQGVTALVLTGASLEADSFCAGWSNDVEGQYLLNDGEARALLPDRVPDNLADSSCLFAKVFFEGEVGMKRADGKKVTLDLSGLVLTGDFTSTGDTSLVCKPAALNGGTSGGCEAASSPVRAWWVFLGLMGAAIALARGRRRATQVVVR